MEMTRKRIIITVLVVVGIGCSVGWNQYGYKTQSESEVCFESIQIGTSFDEVKTRLDACGFKLKPMFDGGPPQIENRCVYKHSETWCSFEVENGRISDKRRWIPESSARRSWRQAIDRTVRFLTDIR